MAGTRCIYVHDVDKWPSSHSQAVDVHHIILGKSASKGFLKLLAFLLLANSSYNFLVKDKPVVSCLWSLLLAAFFVKLLIWNRVKKESVVVFPAFGVQLETHYESGRIFRHFVPISKILKPVLIECVTPVTCYWSLSLILRGEEEMLLVIKELRPPVKMLVPIWKALESLDITESEERVGEVTVV